MNGELAPKHEIPAVFDLVQRIVASEIDNAVRSFFENLGSNTKGPVIQPLADNRSAEPSCLEVDSPEFKAAVERARVDVDCAPEMMARARVGGGLDRASACSPG